MPRGNWLVMRVNGEREPQEGKPTLATVRKTIGCDAIDAVVLTKNSAGIPETVMIVDDTGMLDRKAVNGEATRLYHAVRDTPYSIHGDVAIVNDEDFE